MMSFLFLLTSLVSAQESYTIHRVEKARNQAVVATTTAHDFKIGDQFTLETPNGICYADVKNIVTDYLYLNMEQCQLEFVRTGATVIPVGKVVVERIRTIQEVPVVPADNQAVTSNTTGSGLEFMDSEFFQTYVKGRLSGTLSYLTGTTLDGRVSIGNGSTIEDFKGSNTFALGLDYKVYDLPNTAFSFSAGMSYHLPRSYGRYELQTPAGNQGASFAGSPRLEVVSLYGNVRYNFRNDAFAFFGINHLFADASGLPGSMSGDFGVHTGARYYPVENFFAEGSLNFYNLDYQFQSRTTDFSMTELELKGGYTF